MRAEFGEWQSARPHSGWIWAALAACTAALLAVPDLGTKSFWLDEAASVALASQPNLLHVAGADGGNFAVYYLLLHAWLWFGSSDTFVRALSVIPAVASVVALFALARELFGIRAAAIAAFALALNPFFVAYAQEARGYSLFLFASIVSTMLFVKTFAYPDAPLIRAGYVIASVLTVYVHFFGVFLIAAHAITMLLSDRHRASWRVFSSAAAAMIALLLPLAYQAHRSGTGQISWIPPLSIGGFASASADLAGGSILLALYGMLALFTLPRIRRDAFSGGRTAGMSPLALTISWIVVPVAGAALFSAIVKPIFVARYLIIVLPALALFAGYSLGHLRRRAAFATFGVLLFSASAHGLWAYYFRQPKDDWRGDDWRRIAASIASHAAPGDAVVTSPDFLSVPLRHAAGQLPKGERFPTIVGMSGLLFDPAFSRSVVPRALDQHPRVWTVMYSRELQPARSDGGETYPGEMQYASTILEALKRRKHLSSEASFAGANVIDIRLYSQTRAAPFR